MKILFIYSFLITLIGCSSPHNVNKNQLQAWNGTFWGMSEQDLKIHLERKLNLKNYSESFCAEEQLKYNNLKKENCKFISLDKYKIANNHYNLSFLLENNKLEKINFSHKESYEIMGEREEKNEDILVNMTRVRQSGMTATLELRDLLTKKYGTPEQVTEVDDKFEYLWDLGYTNIKLSTIGGIGSYLNYQPDKTQIYLDNLPEEHNKI